MGFTTQRGPRVRANAYSFRAGPLEDHTHSEGILHNCLRKRFLCFFVDESIKSSADSMANAVLQIRDGVTGKLKLQAAPHELTNCSGHGPNWVHQRLMIADFAGKGHPQDFVVKLGANVVAFNSELKVLWGYENPWTEYGKCPSYIPAVGDIDEDGRDEVLGGYSLIDHDGTVLWEKQIAPHNDSVTICPWDNGMRRAVCSGHGHVLDATGSVILKLGEERVPHGQEVRVGRFEVSNSDPQMVIRWNAHNTDIILVDVAGNILNRLNINASPNNTGMEVVHWNGDNGPDLLYNGGILWDPVQGTAMQLPGLPSPRGISRMDWYHCIPANLCGDEREELILYNPWQSKIHIYTQADNDANQRVPYVAGPRQYNPRLMD